VSIPIELNYQFNVPPDTIYILVVFFTWLILTNKTVQENSRP